jgi:hypothetical protein
MIAAGVAVVMVWFLIFHGSFSRLDVVVKRIQLIDANHEYNSRELPNLCKLKHENNV